MKDRRGIQGPPVFQIWCNSDQYSWSYGILKKLALRHFCLVAAILNVSVEPNQVKKGRPTNFSPIDHYVSPSRGIRFVLHAAVFSLSLSFSFSLSVSLCLSLSLSLSLSLPLSLSLFLSFFLSFVNFFLE